MANTRSEQKKRRNMKATLNHEMEVALPADDLWAAYRGTRLGELVVKLLPHVIEKVDLVEGDGGPGTIVRLHFPSGSPLSSYKEKYLVMDDEKRVKKVAVVEGGYLELGFRSYSVCLEILKKDDSSAIVKSTIEYELDEEFAANAACVSTDTVTLLHDAITKYLLEQKKPSA